MIRLIALLTVSVLLLPIRADAEDPFAVPDEVRAACVEWGRYYGIDPGLLGAICWKESRFRYAENGRYKGLMQIDVNLHSGRLNNLGISDISDPSQAVHAGASLLWGISDHGKKEAAVALLGYSGSGGTRMTAYVRSVLELAAQYDERGTFN